MQWRPKEARSKAQHKRSKGERPPVQARSNQPARSEPGKAHRTKASADKDLAEPRRKQPKYSRLHKPEDMSLEDWQIELRRQFGREQNFELENRGEHPIFSEFQVANPQSQSTYTVHIRGHRVGENYCSCPDFATNTLGTCKHIEFTLAVLEQKPGAVAKLRAGYQPPASEVYLQYGAQREVRFRPGSACPIELARLASRYFGADGGLLPDAFGRFETFLSQARTLDPELRCFDDVLTFIAEVRDGEQRRQRIDEVCPRGIRSAVFQQPAQGLALRLPARGRPVRRPRRPLPDRRRDGPRQDHPGHRRRRAHGPALRRRTRPRRLPHLPQAPVAARDRTLLHSLLRGHERPPPAPRAPLSPPTPSSRSPITTPSIAISTSSSSGRRTWSSSTRPSASRTGTPAPPAASSASSRPMPSSSPARPWKTGSKS